MELKELIKNNTELFYTFTKISIIHKIIAGRERDLEDVKNILLKNREIDKKYIKKWFLEFESITDEKLVKRFENLLRRCQL